MGPPSYMRSVVDRNVVIRSIPVMWNVPMEQSVLGGLRGREVLCVYSEIHSFIQPEIHQK